MQVGLVLSLKTYLMQMIRRLMDIFYYLNLHK